MYHRFTKRFAFFFPLFFFFLITPAHSETIRVVTEELPPFNYTEDGVVKGFSTEVVKSVLAEAGFGSNFNSYPWKRAYEIALRSPNTLIYSIGRNQIREHKFKWVGVIAPVNIYFYKLRSRPDIWIRSIDDAKQFKIGVVREDYTTQYLHSKAFKNLDVASSYVLTIRKLFQGRVDLIPIDELTIASIIHKEAGIGNTYSLPEIEKAMFLEEISSGMYMAFSFGTSNAIVEKCREALEKIKKNGRYDDILTRYLN